MKTSQEIQSTHFAASLGIELSIQLGNEGKKFKSGLVGMQQDRYLIVQLPQPGSLSKKLREGMDLILRYVHAGSVYGCMVTVRGLIVRPFPLLFLSFPDRVERLELRKVKRVECLLPARAEGTRQKVKGMIRDISIGGVLFSTRAEPGQPAAAFDMEENILLSFPLLGMEGEQEFAGRVRRVTQDREGASMGVEFETLPDEIAQRIESYINTINAFHNT